MKKALHVVRSLNPKNGGTSISVPELARATSNTGDYINYVVEFQDRGALSSRLSEHPSTGVAIEWEPIKLYLERLFPGPLSSMVEDSDIVQIHGLWQAHCLATSVAAAKKKKPLMISAHGMLEPWALRNKSWKKLPYSLLFERPNLARAACLRALTLTEANQFRAFGLKSPIALIPNGVRVPCSVDRSIFHAEYPLLKGKRILLFLSRIHFKKGLDILCRAWTQVHKKYPDTVLVLAGPDWEGTRAKVETLLSELQISDRVFFTGMLSGDLKWSAFAAAHAFLLPSYSEGFSMAILEALACGLPCIITRQCNFPVVMNKCGWVIEPEVEELKSVMCASLDQTAQARSKFSSAARDLIQQKYTWSTVGRQMAETYDWMLGGSIPSNTEIILN